MYSGPCVPVSRARAACRSRRSVRVLGRSARSPASDGGAVDPAATTMAVASAGPPWGAASGRATRRLELRAAAGRCTALARSGPSCVP